MTLRFNVWCQTTVVFCVVVLTSADNEYGNKLTKLWSLASASNSGGARTAVVNVTSASILIEPLNQETRTSRDSKQPFYPRYAFKPRAIPVKRGEQPSQVERSVYYAQDNNRYKTEVLFPGNYFQIAEEKSDENSTKDAFNPLEGGPFQPKSIPLMRDNEFQRRSLDEVEEEPLIEKPGGYYEPSAQRRSISYLFGVGGDEEDDSGDDEADGEYELEEDAGNPETKHKKPLKLKKKKPKKLTKYMMPLLMAYKLKYFALVPVMIAGMVLLVGATGLAGFFFALFAAVMGLQKGSY